MSNYKQLDLVKRGERIIFGQNQLDQLLAAGWQVVEQSTEDEARTKDGECTCLVKCRLKRSERSGRTPETAGSHRCTRESGQ
jgi:hypothetical protein